MNGGWLPSSLPTWSAILRLTFGVRGTGRLMSQIHTVDSCSDLDSQPALLRPWRDFACRSRKRSVIEAALASVAEVGHGSEDQPLHASELGHAGNLEHINAAASFFRQNHFLRFGISTHKPVTLISALQWNSRQFGPSIAKCSRVDLENVP